MFNVQETLLVKSELLAKLQNENTQKLRILSSLQEEQKHLTVIIEQQNSQKVNDSILTIFLFYYLVLSVCSYNFYFNYYEHLFIRAYITHIRKHTKIICV